MDILEQSPKLSVRELFSTLWWSVKLGFEISPVFYTLKFINWQARTILPILEAYLGSLVIARLIEVLATSSTVVPQDLFLLVALTTAAVTADRIVSDLTDYLNMRFDYEFAGNMLPKYIARMAELDLQYHEHPKFRILQSKVEDVLNWKGAALMDRVAHLIANIVGLLFLAYIFSTINLVFIIFILLPIFINFYINKQFGANIYYIWEWGGEENTEAVNSYYVFNRQSESIAEAKIYGFGKFIADRFAKFSRKYTQKLIKQNNEKYALLGGATILDQIIFAGIQIWLIFQVVERVISIQGYTFYLQTISQVAKNFDSIQDHLTRLYDFGLYMRDFRKFITMPDIVQKPVNGIKLEQIAPQIELRNVNFKYPTTDTKVLENVSFTVNAGEKVALVGRNGAGKTTLIKLLARFYDPTSGEILVNEHDLKSVDIKSYYKLWGVLFQHFAAYWFTLRENIGLGNVEDIENTELIAAAGKKAGIDTTILPKLSKGYETMLNTEFKDGADLSGGEWQKVGLARGFFANPKLIILDEPTSALDAIAEQEIFDEIQKISADTTMIIVSHRFATVRNADRIVVLDKGTIVENGTHEELITKKGLYHEMFTTQAEGYK